MAWPSERSRDGGVDEIPLGDAVPGRLFLCGKHAVGPDPESLLARVGGTTVVCLNETRELEARYPQYVAWLSAKGVHHPIPDLHAPSLEDFTALVEQLYGLVLAGESIVVSCGAGVGRAGTVAVGLLVRLGATLTDALETVRAHRPMAGPEVGAQADVLAAYAELSGKSVPPRHRFA